MALGLPVAGDDVGGRIWWRSSQPPLSGVRAMPEHRVRDRSTSITLAGALCRAGLLACALGGGEVAGQADRGAERATAPMLDLTRAVVVVPKDLSRPEQKAVAMLVDEVERRSQVRWKVERQWPDGKGPVIA